MSPNLDMAKLHISLPQMLDLALGTPKVGAVNLNLLHNFLHVLLHLNDLKSTKVEYRGEDANRIKTMISSSLKPGPSVHLHEYSITNSCGKIHHRNSKNIDKEIKVDAYIDVDSTSSQLKTEKVTASAPPTARDAISNENITNCKLGAKKARGVKHKIVGEVCRETESVIFVEPLLDGVAPTALTFKKLEESIKKLQLQFCAVEELVNNSEMIERMIGKSNDPVPDMRQAININKRLDASEQGIDKLTTMLHDFINNEKPERHAGGGDIVEEVAHMNRRLSELEDNISLLGNDMIQLQDQNINIERINQDNNKQPTKSIIEKQSQDDVKHYSTSSLTDDKTDLIDPNALGEVNCCKMRIDIMSMTTTLTQVKEEICNLRGKVYEISKLHDTKAESNKIKSRNIKKCNISSEGAPEDKYVVIKQKQIDLKPSRCADLICNVEQSLTNTIQCIDGRFQNFEEYVNCSLRNINDIISKNKNEEELLKYVQAVRLDLEDVRKDVLVLQSNADTQIKQNEIFQEQVEVLKIVKADKEEVEEALADKADICALNKKVSHEQFDAVCDDLTRGLNEAIAKLSQQESIWQQSLGALRCEIDGKLDELEIPGFKDFINNEMQALKNQLRLLSENKREQEAAGARKLLRDMRCVSCDKDAFMQTDAKMFNGSDPFPCKPSIKPYLTFKMDQVRKQQKILSQGKNLLHLEKIMNKNTEKNKSTCAETCENISRDHICNRYCGGSHTIISPQQRIARSKNCVTQWDVHDLQLVEGFVEGTDGKMYRGRWFLGQDGAKTNQPKV